MTINKEQLRELIIRPTLKHLNLWSVEAEDLLMGTAAQESHLGTYVKQVGGGPALGIFQMEPNTHDDIWGSYLKYKRSIANLVEDESSSINHQYNESDGDSVASNELIGNLRYAAAMARVHYLRVPESLPSKSELPAHNYVHELASYWKAYYNTPRGAGTIEEFIVNYNKYVA